ncbi:trimeric intracellular cation channel family protein [Gelidibacter salicanalis]|uniref:Trimeric intracellular cation channel family protein n=1 Tax=Gelidibacter salicanalis TaxID=291193 RepID=A0A5C7A9U6_9FLAO|nr:trimeric intracellular cation channel family protein [Gelidibacter salicanalis]MCK0125078.1 trimeric intracellular cation channel family protein [Gelidibacter sp. F2691]TXE05500.1 trimeric intracellular cation channel family protein [Gelidibacter salicanalis]
MESLRVIEIVGTAAFSIAGTFAAMEKKLDVFGTFIIAFITALGGGTLRDILIGEVPVKWLFEYGAGLIVLLSTIAGLLFRTLIKNYHNVLLFFDSIGLGFFTVVGIQTGISLGMHPLSCIALGTITACFGGVIRDISLSNIPLIFQKEIYATTCILGGTVFFILLELGVPLLPVEIICLLTIVLFRLLSVKFNWHLPTIWKTT